MKLIDVPIYNEQNELQFTVSLTSEEAQYLLQFALNFKLAMAATMGMSVVGARPEEEADTTLQ